MWHGLTGDSSSGDASIESDSGAGEETEKEAAATVLDNRGHTGRILTQLASDEGHGTIIHPASTSDSDLVSDAESESESGSGSESSSRSLSSSVGAAIGDDSGVAWRRRSGGLKSSLKATSRATGAARNHFAASRFRRNISAPKRYDDYEQRTLERAMEASDP